MLTGHLIINLLIMLAVAWPVGALFVRMGLPVMLGQIVTGLVLMVFITTLLVPLMLKWSVMNTCSGSEKEQFCQLWFDSKQTK